MSTEIRVNDPAAFSRSIASTDTLGNASLAQIFLASHPVGCWFGTSVADNPSTYYGGLVGGTWVLASAGSVLLAADGTTYLAGTTYGASSVTLSTANLPSHTHTATLTNPSVTISASSVQTNVDTNASTSPVNNYLAPLTDDNAGGLPLGYTSALTSGHTGNLAGVTVSGGSVSNSNTGSGTSFSIVPLSVGAYLWHRTA